MSKDNGETAVIFARIPKTLVETIKQEAAREDRTVTAYVKRVLTDHIDRAKDSPAEQPKIYAAR